MVVVTRSVTAREAARQESKGVREADARAKIAREGAEERQTPPQGSDGTTSSMSESGEAEFPGAAPLGNLKELGDESESSGGVSAVNANTGARDGRADSTPPLPSNRKRKYIAETESESSLSDDEEEDFSTTNAVVGVTAGAVEQPMIAFPRRSYRKRQRTLFYPG
jgi:hypothetical protein